MIHFTRFFARFGAAAAEGSGAAPFGAYERMLALRYMRSRRNRWLPSAIAGLSVTGITVGVMSLIVVMSVMNGMRDEMISKLIGVNGHIFIQPIDTPLTDYREVTAQLRKIPGITFAFPMVENAAGISSPQQQTGALVRGVTEADLKRLPGIVGNVRQGTLDHFDDKVGVVIGEKLAETLGVQVGDKVSILTAKGAQTPFGVTPRLKAYPVKAIYQSGLYDFDQLIVFMPLAEAQAFFNRPDEANIIEGFVAHPDKVDAVRERIVQAITRPIMLTDWRQRYKSFFDVLKVESDSIFLILAIIVAVASLLIVQGLILLVKDKGRDIAILRTMGATRGSILRVFILTGLSIGATGAILGTALGVPLALQLENIRTFVNRTFNLNLFPADIYHLSQLPSSLDLHEVGGIAVLTLCLSFLATLYPSWRAARLDPVEALRHE
ncbi:lipoprotein-releasing ABC transporter permease subunit [Rhodoblastus acidophilus]|uniref:Lipoprotein-releasing ABC transporter permease subunit n=1 Tax=Candidatus Rhodoblastus alkanivorans TaxID=2954117 RepID=A0ABS9Z5J9_9HYPH|nr:lipoprotein-releasing ABC transporter permease subunit [Candidatus Rhodoblastus alkanivorans]MCI4678414.1 lipoprotein-releasing ABC transporter permease subunit [Candidatus Rhodoblastus alkanivorans]MCI4682913.1 lipoprotein-releasing ABC transporter permease subunit [Candidatus Rhodoblastus alkanivorans]MDI4640223.1 lipoprotein-releasing ABC transporter permease subunit [Rhodoblastus acidophilus]